MKHNFDEEKAFWYRETRSHASHYSKSLSLHVCRFFAMQPHQRATHIKTSSTHQQHSHQLANILKWLTAINCGNETLHGDQHSKHNSDTVIQHPRWKTWLLHIYQNNVIPSTR